MIGFDNLLRIDSKLAKPSSFTAARAFADDPKIVYTIPDARKRMNIHYAFEYFLRTAVYGHEEAYTTSSNCEGIAIWSHSEKKVPFWAQVKANPLLSLRCGWRFISCQMTANRLSMEIKKQYAPSRHMYLALLAVDPTHHGKGYASALLKPMLARLDKEHLPAYLETQNMKNVAMYQYFGFQLVHETVLPKTTFPIYCMLRTT